MSDTVFWWTGAAIWIGLPSYAVLFVLTWITEVTILVGRFWVAGIVTSLPRAWWSIFKETGDVTYTLKNGKNVKRPSLVAYTFGLLP